MSVIGKTNGYTNLRAGPGVSWPAQQILKRGAVLVMDEAEGSEAGRKWRHVFSVDGAQVNGYVADWLVQVILQNPCGGVCAFCHKPIT